KSPQVRPVRPDSESAGVQSPPKQLLGRSEAPISRARSWPQPGYLGPGRARPAARSGQGLASPLGTTPLGDSSFFLGAGSRRPAFLFNRSRHNNRWLLASPLAAFLAATQASLRSWFPQTTSV